MVQAGCVSVGLCGWCRLGVFLLDFVDGAGWVCFCWTLWMVQAGCVSVAGIHLSKT